MLRLLAILTAFFALAAAATPAAAEPTLPPPVDLRCDGATDPLAATASPHLTWRLPAMDSGATTAAWQVLAATDPALLTAGRADLWDSGKRPATRQVGTHYAGRPRSVGDRCHWQVRWWAADGSVSAWSEPACWEVAPQQPADWQGARWITDGSRTPSADADFYQDDPAPLMRREFVISKPVKHARLHLAGLGLCLPSLDGKRLDDHVFDPPWTNFDKRIHFRTHDLTDQLGQGTHCLGLRLGNGWYNPLPLRMWGGRNIREALPVGRPRAIACLVVTHPDDSKTTIVSDASWTTAPGPTLRNNLYLGEKRDARLEIDGWDRPGFDADGWAKVTPTDASLEPLEALRMPPVRLLDPIRPEQITEPLDDIYVVDFGTNLTGVPELEFEADPGQEVHFRFGELLYPDGTLNPMTSVCGQLKGLRRGPDGNLQPKGGPGAPRIAWQKDHYIARGGVQTYRPDFTFHAFRYMEIRGLKEAPTPARCRVRPLRTDLVTVGDFSCSDPLLNEIQAMCRRTFLANVVTVQSDCPHRERFSYGGDIVATSEAFLMNFDMHQFYAKTARDWADAVRPDGRLTDTAPFVGIDYCGVGWAMVHPLLVEQLHQYHGDQALVAEQAEVAMRWLRVVAEGRENGLVTRGLTDHEALVRTRGGPQLLTPMFIDAARRVARLHDLIDRPEAAAEARRWAAESATAWRKNHYDPQRGLVGGGSQSEQCFALGFGAGPEEDRAQTFDALVAALNRTEDAPRLTTGIYGTRILLEVLPARGRPDLAYALATRRSFPSWGHMLENGATTLWEHWEGSDNTFSHNHPMFGSVSAWMFRWLGGIQCQAGAVGFDRIAIRPRIPADLDWVKCSHQSVRGLIRSDWTVEGDTRRFDITIPPDTLAEIELPRRENDRLEMSSSRPNLPQATRTADFFRFAAPPGNYRITLQPEG